MIENFVQISKFPNPNDPLTWRQNIDKSGLNVSGIFITEKFSSESLQIMGMGIWVEALYRWIGPARSVFASGKVTVKQRIDPDTNTMHSVQIPDYIDIIAEMVNLSASLNIFQNNGVDYFSFQNRHVEHKLDYNLVLFQVILHHLLNKCICMELKEH